MLTPLDKKRIGIINCRMSVIRRKIENTLIWNNEGYLNDDRVNLLRLWNSFYQASNLIKMNSLTVKDFNRIAITNERMK